MADFRPTNTIVRRTDTYRFTVTNLKDPSLLELKRQIAQHNRYVRERVRNGKAVVEDWTNRGEYNSMSLRRVRIMPRGPRNEPGKKDYPDREWGETAYWSYLPQRYGTHYDIYVHDDTTANHVLREEMETGLRPGQQRRISEMRQEMARIEMEHLKELREHGIAVYYDRNGKQYSSIEKRRELLRETTNMSEETIARIT